MTIFDGSTFVRQNCGQLAVRWGWTFLGLGHLLSREQGQSQSD